MCITQLFVGKGSNMSTLSQRSSSLERSFQIRFEQVSWIHSEKLQQQEKSDRIGGNGHCRELWIVKSQKSSLWFEIKNRNELVISYGNSYHILFFTTNHSTQINIQFDCSLENYLEYGYCVQVVLISRGILCNYIGTNTFQFQLTLCIDLTICSRQQYSVKFPMFEEALLI